MSTASAIPPVGIGTKLIYGFGSLAYGVKDVAFRAYILIFYNQVVGVSATTVSAAIFVALILDAVIDPAIGQWSDNFRSRFGRRHPFMYASAVPVAGTFLLVWLPPSGWSDAAMFWWILGVAVMVRGFLSLYEIPSSSLAPELSRDYDERTSILSYRYFFGYLGGLGMSFAALKIFLAPTADYPIGQLNPAGYWHFAIAGAIVMLASILLSAMGTHHRIKYMRQLPPPPRVSLGQTLRHMGESFSDRGFLALMSFGVLKYTAVGLYAALAIYFGTYLWQLNSGALAILSLDGILAAAGAMWLAPFLSKRIGKTAAAFSLAVLAVLVVSVPYALRLAGLFWDNGSPALVPALFVFQGIFGLCGIASMILTASMVSDVTDASEVRTGRRTEGLFFAAASFMQQCVSGLGIMVAGVVIDLAGLTPGTTPADVPLEVVNRLVLYAIPLVVGLYIVGACFLYFYRHTRESHDANIATLGEAGALVDEPDPGAKKAAIAHTQIS